MDPIKNDDQNQHTQKRDIQKERKLGMDVKDL
jgi:hypothetical protein